MGHNYYWRGISADWKNHNGTNWVDDNGVACGECNYPTTGDTAIFDRAVAHWPDMSACIAAYVVLERVVISKAFLRGMNSKEEM